MKNCDSLAYTFRASGTVVHFQRFNDLFAIEMPIFFVIIHSLNESIFTMFCFQESIYISDVLTSRCDSTRPGTIPDLTRRYLGGDIREFSVYYFRKEYEHELRFTKAVYPNHTKQKWSIVHFNSKTILVCDPTFTY